MANAKDDSDINQREDSILKYIENNNVEYALNKAEALCSEFTNLKTLLIQWKSSHTGIEEKKKANVVDDNILSREERGIKYSFSKTIQEFQDEKLPKYFDLKPFDQEMDSIKNQETLMLKIMEQRLEPMGFTIPEKKDENIGHHPQQLIYGSSSIIIPIRKEASKLDAIAQVFRKVSLGKDEKANFEKLVNLRHRNVVKILDCELERYPFFFIKEYVYGKTLEDSVRTVGARPISQVVDWMYQLADALLYLSQKEIMHFNVRPSKIFIDHEFHLLISPVFSASDRNSQGDGGGVNIQNFWEVCKYGSPELLKHYGPQKAMLESTRFVCASEQFSLGLLAYFALCGEDLFEGDSVLSVLKVRDAFEKNPDYFLKKLDHLQKFVVDGEEKCLIPILRKLLQIEPEDRYDNLHTLIKELHVLTHAECTYDTVVQKSYRRAVATNRELVREFYDKLKEKSETAKEAFPDSVNLYKQHAMLQMAIDLLINLDDPKKMKILGRILDISKSKNPQAKSTSKNPHATLTTQDFDIFLDTLITVIARSDPYFKKDPEIARGWDEVKSGFLKKMEYPPEI
jgi:serine/threonine protein kinase